MNKDLNEVIEDSIAIIGMAGRFPGANNIKQFWENICIGKESISFFSDDELLASGINPQELRDPSYVKAKGLMKDIDKFDAKFFNILPKDAVILDPQQRVLLECIWTALEDAGYFSEKQAGVTAVYVGAGFNTYYPKIILPNSKVVDEAGDVSIALGNGNDYVSTRISYKLNLTGPSMTVQTACSTSLVAVSMACVSLLNYQCDMAIAGGGSAFFPIKSGYLYQKEFIFSADGHCRPFDAKATGTVFGMGAGIVILKRLADALKDHDHIYAVIRGSAVNNDGSVKVGYTAPAQEGQTHVIRQAQALAQIDPDTIGFVETHGTGTPIGDPIEIAALTAAFKRQTEKKQFCALGTLKANVGHLDTAAGVAGLIKTVLVLQHQKIPPAINFTEPNPQIDFKESPFYIPLELQNWKKTDAPRRASVSSFGVGGTNAHIVLEEAPTSLKTSSLTKPCYLATFSARTDAALMQRLLDFEKWLQEHQNEHTLEEISYTLNLGRKQFEKRFAFVVDSNSELQDVIKEAILVKKSESVPLSQNDISRLMDDLEDSQMVDKERYRESLQAIANEFINGKNEIDWERLHKNESNNRISLPTYPFERIRYWVPEVTKSTNKIHFYHPIWTKASSKFENQVINQSCWFFQSEPGQQLVTEVKKFFPDLEQKPFPPQASFLGEQLPRYVIFYVDPRSTDYSSLLKMSFFALFSLAKWAIKIKSQQPIDFIYSFLSHPDAKSDPFFDALSGFLKTLTQEYPRLRGRLLHMDEETVGHYSTFAKAIISTLLETERYVRFLKQERFIQAFEPISLPDSGIKSFRKNGVYFITGGASGLGWLIARYLISTYQARLVLMGRSALSSEQQAQMTELSSDILYERGDVSNREDVERALNRCREQFGKIQGIIHCAGVIHDSLLLKKSKKEVEQVFAPKILGTLHLDELTRKDNLEFFLLFSSISALFGNIGQSDYSYANGFLDHFAEERQAKMISIDWPPWDVGNMQVSQPIRDWMQKQFDSYPLSASQGIAALEQACSLPYSQVVILSGDKSKLDTYLTSCFSDLQPLELKPAHSDDIDQIIKKLLSILTEITQLPQEDFGLEVSFFDMGFDSIILAQLISRIEAEWKVSLNSVVQEIMMKPTLSNISHQIKAVIGQEISKNDKNSDGSSFGSQIVEL